MAVTGTVISAIATVGSLYQGYQAQQSQEAAQEDQEEANKITQKQNQLQQQENIRRAIARSRVARANAEASGAAAGGGGASVASGAPGAETTGTAANVGFALGQNRMQNDRFDLLISAGQNQQDANRAQAIGGFLGASSQFGGGGAGFANMARYGYNRFSNNGEG